ncbi:MAG: hypothetical protein ACON37_09035 [Candidatus Puniceispirillaceae bacterium]
MASAVQARVVATFNCEVISATALSVEEGRSLYFGQSDDHRGKRLQLKIIMQPDPDYDLFYELKPELKMTNSISFMQPIGSYDIELKKNRLVGGSFLGGVELSSDRVRFYASDTQVINLERYYRSDFHGFMILSQLMSTWTYGLNCQSSEYDERDFFNFHKSWNK